MSKVPPEYTPQADFSAIAQQPIARTGLPGAEMDGEFVRVGDSLNQTIRRLSEIQRDDGALRPGIVALEQFAADVYSILAGSQALNPTIWVQGVTYQPGDLVQNPTSMDALMVSDPTAYGIPAGFLGEYPVSADPFERNSNGTYWIAKWTSGDVGPFAPNESGQVWAIGDGPVLGLGTTIYYRQRGNAIYSSPADVEEWVVGEFSNGTIVPLDVSSTELPLYGTYVCIEAHTADTTFGADAEKWMLVASPLVANTMLTDRFSGDNSTSAFQLSSPAPSRDNTLVFVDGEYVSKADYSLGGSNDQIIFATPPGPGAFIEVNYGVSARSVTINIADGSVTTAKLADGAVTGAKLADGSIPASKLSGELAGSQLADEAVTEAKLAAAAVTADKLAPNAVTQGRIAAGAVSNAALASAAVTGAKIANGTITGNKLAAGALTLNGEPTAATHATTKGYVDDKVATDVGTASAALQAGIDARLPLAGGTLTGPVTFDEAPMPLPSGDAPLFACRAFARIDVTAAADKTGTYTRNGSGIVTVTIAAHGLRVGDYVWLDFTTGGATDALFQVATAPDANTFTVAQAGGAISTSNVTAKFYTITHGGNVSSATPTQSLTPIQRIAVNFTTPLPTGEYAVTGTTLNGGSLAESDNNGTNTPQTVFLEAGAGTVDAYNIAVFA